MDLTDKNRYQFQPWYIKAVRWIRYKPLWSIWGAFVVSWWFLTGAKIPAEEKLFFDRKYKGRWLVRWHYAKHIMRCYLSMADFGMRNCWYLQEVIDDLRAKANGASAN